MEREGCSLMSMEKKRPQLNLTELYQLKWVLGGALAVLSAWTVLYMEVEAWLWLVLITVAVPVVMRWPVLTLYVPRWAHRLAFPLFVALFAVDYYLNREPLPAMIRLALMLVLYRSVTPRKRRDDLQLIVLGLFLVVIAGVLSVSLAFAFQIIVFTGCTLMFLLVITLIDSAESGHVATGFSASAPPAWMRIEWLRLARRLHAATDWRVALLGAGLFSGVVGLSALLFFALPRFEFSNTFFLDNMISKQSRTGFSESVGFGDVTDIKQDNSVALRVDVSDPRFIPADPYWRMLVLDSYKDGMFSMSDQLKTQLLTQGAKTARVAGSLRPRVATATWVFYLEGGVSRFLPMLGSFYSLQFNDGPQSYAINDELRLLSMEKTPPKMFAYRVDGMRNEAELGAVEIIQPRTDRRSRHRAEFDESDPRVPASMPTFLKIDLEETDTAQVHSMVEALNAPVADARAFASRASAWLGGKHAYSLQMNQGKGEGDPLVRWMASTTPGHCELFAGAFTLLARTAGYPARMITGFRGGTWNPGSQNLTIRNSDAHAWCEIYDSAAQVWVRVDPTPGSMMPGQVQTEESTEARLARISDKSWSAKLDGLRMFWYRRIVDFDHSTQAELAHDAKEALQSRAKALKAMINRRLEAIGAWLQEPWDVTRLAAWALIVLTAFALVLGWKAYGRGLVMRWRSGLTRRGVDPVRREAGRWLSRITEHETTGNQAELAQVRADLERLRYGPRQSWPNPQGAFTRAKRACRLAKR
jgi:transglutaminase-like putative cysteine protease